jgi:hypothetical protein
MSFVEEANLNDILGAARFCHGLCRCGRSRFVDENIAETTLGAFQLTLLIGLDLVERLIVVLQNVIHRLVIALGQFRSRPD